MAAMALGKRGQEQEELFVRHQQLRAQSHRYYQALNKILAGAGFDRHVEAVCAKFYAQKMGRPSLPPGVYFRCLLVGYFEGIEQRDGASPGGRPTRWEACVTSWVLSGEQVDA